MSTDARKLNGSPEPTLQESIEQYRFLADAMPQQVWTATPDGALDYVNLRTTDYFGKSASEIIGAGWQAVIHPDDLPACLEAWLHSLQTGDPYQIEFRLHASDGSYKWHLGRALAQMSNGSIVKWYGTNTDIDEYKRLQAQKDEFIGMASHELKTPVTSMKGFTNLLQRRFRRQGDEQALLYLDKIDQQVGKLTNLISDLLDITKVQMGKLPYREEHFDLDVLIQETVESIQGITTTHQLHIEQVVSVQVFGDRDRLGQVVTNLLNNAMKYSPQADKVVIRIVKDSNDAIVSVQDFGIGIAEVHQQKIFERFYQVAESVEKTYPGLGIGLYLSNEIIKRHKGRLWVQSTKGQGSTFHFAVPVS